MKPAPALLASSLLIAASPAPAATGAIGDRACAKAEVEAEILDQLYLGQLPAPKGYISLDGLNRASLKVHRVLFGPLTKGRMSVNFVAPENLREKVKLRFYLAPDEHGEWWIALCTSGRRGP